MAIFRQFSAYQSWQAPARPRGLRLLVTVRYDRYRIASPLVLSPKSRLFGDPDQLSAPNFSRNLAHFQSFGVLSEQIFVWSRQNHSEP
jgi:hypothetical protein